MPDFERVRQIKTESRERLFAIPGVHGIAVGWKKTAGEYTNEQSIVVFVTHKRPLDELEPEELIPREIDGVRVDVVESPVPRQLSPDDTSYPSLRGGIQLFSGGDHRGEGTLGFIAQSSDGQKIYAVTNQHVLLVSQNQVSTLNQDVQPQGLHSSPVQLTFTTPAFNSIFPGTVVAVKISRQASTAPFKIDRFVVVYSTIANDTDTKVAQRVSQLIQDLNAVQVTPPGSGRTITISPSPGFIKIGLECETFGKKLREDSGLTAEVIGNVIRFSGQASDPGGAFVNLNPGGPLGTYGVFVPFAEGDDALAAATSTVAALTALKNSTRVSTELSGVTVGRTGAQVTIGGVQEVECEITKDDRVGHPTNRFCCRHHKCCSDRIGRVVAVAMDLDAALIQLDGEQKYIAKVEGIPENGGRVSGTYDIQNSDLVPPDFFKVQKRGRTTLRTTGKVTSLEVEGIISLTSASFPFPSYFHRYYKNAMRIDSSSSDEFSVGGDSGSAVMDHNNRIVGLLFGGGAATNQSPPHGLASPVAGVLDAFKALNVVVATTADPSKELVVPGPSFNFAALPADQVASPIVGGTPLSEGIRKAEAEIEAIPAGKELSDAVRRHASEGYRLVTGNKRVGAVWKRNGGQQIFPALIRMLQNPAARLPEEINGKPLPVCLGNIRRIFERYGSPAFVADLGQWGDRFIGLMSLSYNEMKAALETASPAHLSHA